MQEGEAAAASLGAEEEVVAAEAAALGAEEENLVVSVVEGVEVENLAVEGAVAEEAAVVLVEAAAVVAGTVLVEVDGIVSAEEAESGEVCKLWKTENLEMCSKQIHYTVCSFI